MAHKCEMTGGWVPLRDEDGYHGSAIFFVEEDEQGHFIATNDECASYVNFCPNCGAPAPRRENIMRSIDIEDLTSIPAGDNPFSHDAFNMGKQIGKDLWLMFGNHAEEECKYLILVCTRTGERRRLTFAGR